MKTKFALYFIVLALLSCSQKLTIHNKIFYDGSSPAGLERSFEFREETYVIHLKRNFNDTVGIIFESGNYKIKSKKLIIMPQVKIFCESIRVPKVVDHQLSYPCNGIGENYYNGRYVNRDTINEKEKYYRGFDQQLFYISKFEDRLVLEEKLGVRMLYQK